jgi:hypothetical protein
MPAEVRIREAARMPWDYPFCGKTADMNQRNTSVSLFVIGAAAGLTLTYLGRKARARLRKPITQAMTALVPRDRVEAFVESRERMLEVLESKRKLGLIERLEIRDAPAGRGTELYLTMRGLGKYGVKEVLRRVKVLLEAGEIPTGRRYA